MNKTININLANVFFHIDEDAFLKLDHYLKAIEQYLAKEESKEEILQDIEARIAELFKESQSHKDQVITRLQVDEMIATMGEPEAYKIDDDEETAFGSTKRRASKTLYRDLDRNFFGGVSAGLNYYLGLNLFLIRLIWVVSAVFSFGATVAIYIILWIAIPPARTTSQKLDMQGDPVNLTNIEKKVKEGYNKFADKVGDIDYDKYGRKTKSGINHFVEGLVEVLKAIGKFISKFLGIILLIISSLVLVGLLVFFFSFGTITVFQLGNFDQMDLFSLGAPYWIQVLLYFLTAAIPFFYLMVLSLKLLFRNLKSMGKITHITLIGIWILCIIIISTLAIKKQLEVSIDAEYVEVNSLNISQSDTLSISLNTNLLYQEDIDRFGDQKIIKDETDTSKLFSTDVNVNFRTSTDDELKVRITKNGFGISKREAKEKAALVEYTYTLENSILKLNNYFFTTPEYLNKEVGVNVTVYIPENKVIYLDKSLKKFSRIRNFKSSDYNTYLSYTGHFWKPIDNQIKLDTISTQNQNP